MRNSKMASNLLKVGAVVSLLAMPVVGFAQVDTSQPPNTGFFTQLFSCDPNAGEGVLCILQRVLSFILAIAFIIAVIFLVVGGFRYIVSQGNEEAIEKAKGTITNAIIGIVVIILAYVVLTIVFNLIGTGTA